MFAILDAKNREIKFENFELNSCLSPFKDEHINLYQSSSFTDYEKCIIVFFYSVNVFTVPLINIQ